MKMIFKHAKFSSFFWTQFWGAFNDNFFKNALVILVAFKGVQIAGLSEDMLVALAGGIFILPFFLFSHLAGQVSDKFEKSFIVRATKFFELFVMLIAGLGFLLNSYVLLFFVLFLMGLQSTMFGPVKYSFIPNLVKDEELTEANALVESGTFIAILLGTILGGVTSKHSEAGKLLAMGLACVSCIGIFFSLKVPRGYIGDKKLKIQYNPLPEFRNLYKIISQKLAVSNSVLGISWFWFFGAGVLSVLPIYCKNYLKVDEGVVTLFLAVFTMGIAIGSVLCEKLSFRRAEIGLVPIGSVGLTLFLGHLAFIDPVWVSQTTQHIGVQEFLSYGPAKWILFDFGMMSLFSGLFIVPLYTLIQERSDDEVRSRVIAGNNILNALFMVISSLTVMACYKAGLNPAEVFAVFAVLNVIVALYIYSVVPEFTLRFLSWILSHVLYKVETRGLDNLPRQGAAIVVSNHVTFIDWLLISGALKRPLRFIMYYKFFQIPFVKTLFRQAKIIPIAGAKEDKKILEAAFEKMDFELKDGEVVCIFPEGQLSKDGKVAAFKPGVLKALQENPVPIVPVFLHGLNGSIFSRQKEKSLFQQGFRRRIQLVVEKPIPASQFRLDDLEKVYRKTLDGEEVHSSQ